MRLVRELMKTGVVTVGETTSISETMELMEKKGYSGMPVVDARNQLVGMVSRSDVAVNLARGQVTKESPIGDIMTPFLFEIGPDSTLLSVIETMDRAGIHRVVVTNDRIPVGIVTSMDLVRDYARTLRP